MGACVAIHFVRRRSVGVDAGIEEQSRAVRYWLWLAASVKFLVPFALLVSIGGQIGWRTAPAIRQSQFSFVMDKISQPFEATGPAASFAVSPAWSNSLPAILFVVWLCGFAIGVICWVRWWRQFRAAQRTATPLYLNLPIPVMSSPTRLEPGVFGIHKPVLLLPEGITSRLTEPQLELILAHELCHVRRRDNLTAAVHMVVETIFWFHPLVWWMGTRLVEERERACDEEVLRMASDPDVYAQGILNVCKFYLSSPMACASGVTGADLTRRIEAIVANRRGRNLNATRKILLMTAALAAVVGPAAIGMLSAFPRRGQDRTKTAPPAFEAASVKANPKHVGRTRSIEPGRITYLDTTLGEFIAMAYGVKHYQLSGPDWIVNVGSLDRYDVVATANSSVSAEEVKRMLGPLLVERFHLTFHRETRELPVYAMVVAKGGPKLKQPGDGGAMSMSPNGEGGFSFNNWSMDSLANWLTLVLAGGRPVLDRTGVEGRYTFNANLFNFPKDITPGDMKMGMRDNSDAIFSTLQDQLGLKLESQKAELEILVIDHANKLPAEN
jgi:bla regulator protein blaR1